MRRIMFASFLVVCMTGVSYANGERMAQLYDRLNRLQEENMHLREEVARLRQQRSGCGSLQRDTRGQIPELRRQMDELNALKHSVGRLKR